MFCKYVLVLNHVSSIKIMRGMTYLRAEYMTDVKAPTSETDYNYKLK